MRPFAGIPHPQRPGLFVDDNALLLRRYAYVERRLFLLQAGHFPGTAIWELKHALARHAWEDAQHADALRRRIVTMRCSEHVCDQCPDPALEALMDEVERAAASAELVAGVHGLVKPALLRAYLWHLETTNPVADFPTARELDIIVREEAHQLAWAAEAIAEVAGMTAAGECHDTAEAAGGYAATSVTAITEQPRVPTDAGLRGAAQAGPPIGATQSPEPGAPERALAWQGHLRTFLRAAGGITGRDERGVAEAPRSTERFRISRHPRRDARFTINFQFHEPGDPPPQGVPEELIMMMRGRLNELAATENPAASIYELGDGPGALPWEGLLALSRHMWDEARHSMLGQAVIESLGRDIREWPLRIGPGYSYLSVAPLERYGHLGLNVEQAMMKYPPGKRQEFEWCRDVAKYPLAAMYQDYDWSDEVYHTQIARRWMARALGDGGVPAGWDQMKAFAAVAAARMNANTQAIARLWHEQRAHGRTLAEGDPLPAGVEAAPAGGAPLPSEYDSPPQQPPVE